MNHEFTVELAAKLQKAKSNKQINTDIRLLEKTLNVLQITGMLAKGDTKREANRYIKELSGKLNDIKLKGKIDDKNLKRDIDNSLHHMTFKEIDALQLNGGKASLKLRKVLADLSAYAAKKAIPVNINLKKEKLGNELTAFLNQNSKIEKSGVLLKESERIRELIDSVDDQETLRNATDSFSRFRSELVDMGYAGKSASQIMKGMLTHIKKISGFFGVTSLAVDNFVKALKTLRSNDNILVGISKVSGMTTRQLEELGDEAFKIAGKYGLLSSDYLRGVQEMAASGYEELSKELAELSLLAQSAGNLTAENANGYLLATDAAYRYEGSVEKLSAALDGANHISDRNRVSLTDIAEATRIAASFAADAGVSIDQLTAAEAAMIAATKRSGSEIGGALKSIILNLQQVSGEFDGMTIDEEQLKRFETRCQSLGVKLEYVKDGMTVLRDPMEILKDLASLYNALPDHNSGEKQNLLADLGGKEYADTLGSLLERWDLYEKMLDEFSQGAGSTLEAADRTASSWEGRINSLQNSFDSFINTLTDKEAIKGGISFFDRMIQGAEAFTNAVGEIPVILTAMNSALAASNKDYGITQIWNKDKGRVDLQGNLFGIDFTAIKNMKKHFSEADEAIAKWNAELEAGNADINNLDKAIAQNNAQFKAYLQTTSVDAPASLDGYRSYLNAAGVSTDALRLKTILLNSAISMGIGIAVQFTMEGIMLLVKKIDDAVHASENCRERVNELMSSYQSALDKANDNAKTVEGLASRYEELSKGVNNLGENVSLATDEYNEYNEIVLLPIFFDLQLPSLPVTELTDIMS